MKLEVNTLLMAMAVALVAPASAFAVNTITFNGEVTDQTCVADINGSTDPTVLMKSVPLTDLNGAVGKTAGETTFTLTLSGCTANVASETLTTLFQAPNPTTLGNLTNTAAGGADGVALQLLDAPAGNRVGLAGGGAVTAGAVVLDPNQTTTSHDYAVEYISEKAAVAPGPVLGSVIYTVRYE